MQAHVDNQARRFVRRVFFTGSVALERGQGLCYSRTVAADAGSEALRDKHAALPTSSNNMHFAGVVTQDYPAVSGGQWVEIDEPRSVTRVSILAATTVGVTYLTCSASAGARGRFGLTGFRGKGTGLALQSLAAITDAAGETPGPISSSLDGSATYTTATKTVTKTGAFQYAKAGDFVWIVGGATSASMAAALTPGRYVIASKTSDDAVVLTTAAGAADSKVAFYCVRGNPTVLAILDDGPESGLTEWITPVSATAVPAMVGGRTFIFGGATITTDSTDTLADGTVVGLRKSFKLMGALTTNDWLLTVTTGKQLDGSTALASCEFDGANDESLLEWCGPHWKLHANSGTGLA